MTDEIKSENICDTDIQNVDSVIALYPKVEPLSAVKKYAISQNVSFNFEWALRGYMRNEGKETNIFASFITLIQADPKYYGNYIECLIEEQGISEEVIEETLKYIRSGMLPYQIWIDKILLDVQCGGEYYGKSSVSSIFLVYLLKTMRTSLIGFNKMIAHIEREQDLCEDLMKVVDIAKLNYYAMPQRLKREYHEAFASTDEEMRRKFQDNELTLFCCTLVDMLQCPLSMEAIELIESGQGNSFSTYWVEPPFGCGITLSNNSREPLPRKEGEEEAPQPKQKPAGMGSFAIDVLGYGADGTTPEEIKRRMEEADREANGEEPINLEEEDTSNVQYVVKKVAKHGSTRVMSENRFKTLAEAEKFRREILEAIPDMANSFDFKIEKEYV